MWNRGKIKAKKLSSKNAEAKKKKKKKSECDKSPLFTCYQGIHSKVAQPSCRGGRAPWNGGMPQN